MTTWLAPKQRLSDQRFDMCSSNTSGSRCYPIGYCHGRRELKPDEFVPAEIADRENAKTLPFASKFHTNGHATAEEAAACYDEFQLDLELTFRESQNEQHKCQVCGAWTQGVADLGRSISRRFYVCADHSTRGAIAALSKAAP